MGRPLSRLALLLVSLLSLMIQTAYAATIIYPRPETADDARTDYPTMLLRLALSKSGTSAILTPSADTMQQGRALAMLASGQGMDVVWSMTSKDREATLLPIRIPIYKGLIGWRIPLIRASDLGQFRTVRDLGGLRKLSAGQGHDWPDTDILRSNGIPVFGSPRYDSLFRMLVSSRFDYFPRSVVEIWDEARNHAAEGIAVDPYVVIHYPTAFYYFVNRNNPQLAETIRKGLEAAIADGSFDKLFVEHHTRALEKAALEERTVIELNNPLLPPETPLGRRELWFSKDDLKRMRTAQ